MPIPSQLTQEDIDYLQKQGIDPNTFQIAPQSSGDDMGVTRAALATAKGHAGSYLGGGAGGLAGLAAASWLAGPEVGLPVSLLAATAGGLGGAYAGQKAQQAILPQETEASLEQQAQQAAQEHPLVSGATDIGLSALAGGGRLSLSPIKAALAGSRPALRNLGLMAGMQAGIGAGTDIGSQLYNTGTVNPREVGTSALQGAAGGLLFSNPSRLGKWATNGRWKNIEDIQEQREQPDEITKSLSPTGEEALQTSKAVTDNAVANRFNAAFLQKDDSAINEAQRIYNLKRNADTVLDPTVFPDSLLNKIFKKFLAPINPKMDITDQANALAQNQQLLKMNNAERRQFLYQNILGNIAPDIAKAHQDYQSWWSDAKRQQDQQWVDEQNATVVQRKLEQERAEAAQKERQTAFEQSEAEQEQQRQAEEQEAYRQKNLQDAMANRQQNIVRQAMASGIAPWSRVEKGNLPQQAAQGRMSEVGRAEVVPAQPENVENKGTLTPAENQAALEADKVQAQLENKNAPVEQDKDIIPVPESLQSHISSGKATTGTVLHSLANTPDHPLQALTKDIFNNADQKSLQTPWARRVNPGNRSFYNPREGAVTIQPSDLNDSSVYLEEAIHSLTADKVPPEMLKARGAELYNRIQTYIKSGPNAALKDILQSYLDTAKHLGLHDTLFKDNPDLAGSIEKGLAGNPDELYTLYGNLSSYAMGHPLEFIAHAIRTPEFQRLLDTIPTKDNRTVWQSFVDAVRRLLGVSAKNGTMLNRVLRSSKELMSQERPTGSTGTDIEKTQEPKINEHGQPELPHDPSGTTDDSGNLYSPRSEDSQSEMKKDLLTRTVGRLTRSGIDAVKEIPIAGKTVAKGVQGVFDDYHPNFGHFWAAVDKATKGLNDSEAKHLDQVLQKENLEKKNYQFMLRSDKARSAYNTIRAKLSELSDKLIAEKHPIWENGSPRLMKKDPYYYPNTQNRKVYDAMRQGTDMKTINAAKQDFIQRQMDYNKEGMYYGFAKQWQQHLLDNPNHAGMEAQAKEEYAQSGQGYEKLWQDHLNSVQGNGRRTSNPSLAIFAALRRPERIPLPDSMRNSDVRENLFSYFRRAAMDRAFFNNIENNPEVAGHLGFESDGWGNPVEQKQNIAGNTTVKTILEMVHGEVEPLLQRNESAVENVANAFILGPLTEIHKMISPIGQSFTFADNPIQAAKSFVHAITSLGTGWSHAMENGIVIHKPNDMLDFTKANLTFAEKVNAFANNFRRAYTLNGLTERFSTGYAQAACEYLIRSKIKFAQHGDKTAQELLSRLDPKWEQGKTYTDDETNNLASRLAGYLIGTKDPRTLPAWLLHTNEISSFFKLLNWNVAQTNNFLNNAWAPAMKGNYMPLIMSTLGASLGGYVIRDLRTKLSGRPNQIPSLSDIAASSRGIEGNTAALFYNWISAASYGGLGGIVSLAAKYPLDVHFRNPLQGAIFPLDEIISSYSTAASNVADALANDPTADPVKIVSRAFTDIITKNTQIGRTVFNNAVNAGVISEQSSNPEAAELAFEKHRSDQLNQLKKFKQVEGIPLNPTSDFGGNPYLNMEQKTFKNTQDFGKAAAVLPDIIQKYIQYFGGKSPDMLMSKIEGLKANPYEVFPSLETTPLLFGKYIQFLENKYGEQKTNALLADYMRRKAINEGKSAMVP